jgi:L-threonylcarbamoyladenylate synthase
MKLDLALKILKQGGSVVYPTDTAYGLGVDANNFKAVQKLYKIKGRKNQPTHIIVSSLAMAKRYVQFSKTAEKTFKTFLPGALTIVLPLKKNISKSINLLSADSDTIGIRIPNNKTALELVRRFGNPITTTSANPTNEKTPYSAIDSYNLFKTRKYKPDLYLDEGRLKKIKPSTMVKIINDKIEVLRKGPIEIENIMLNKLYL